MWLTIKLLYTTRYATPMYAFKRVVGHNGKAVLLAVNLGVTDFCGATVSHPYITITPLPRHTAESLILTTKVSYIG